MLQNYFKIAWRNLWRNKAMSFINIIGLTLGVSACLIIYLITSFELSYDTFHPNKERIYRVVGKMTFGTSEEERSAGFVPHPMPMAMREEISGLESVVAFHNLESEVKIPNGEKEPKVFERRDMDAERAGIIIAEPTYFSIFQYEWLAGNPETALNEPYRVVLSEKKARQYFGNLAPEEIIGKEVIYMDSLRVSVSGIVKDWAQLSDFTFTDFLSFSTIQNSFLKNFTNLTDWNDIWSASQAFVKLSENATRTQVEAQFPAFAKAHFTRDLKLKPSLQPLSDLHFNADYQDNYSRKAHLPTLYGLMGIALFILIIAAINFINLSTAQSFQRAKEVGIRKVLGSTRKSLIFQFLSETFILTLIAICLALLVVPSILTIFQSVIPSGVALQFTVPTFVFLAIVLLLTLFLAGFYPSLVLSSYLPVFTLKGNTPLGGSGGQKGYLRKALIVFQFTVSLVFIVGTLVIGNQMNFIRSKEVGVTTDAIITFHTGFDQEAINRGILVEKIKQLADVERVCLQWFTPLGSAFMQTNLKYTGKKVIEMDVSAKVGDENFIPLYDIPLLAGRNIAKSEVLKEFVINETYAKSLGFQKPADAVGQMLEFREQKYPIVGVVADFHEQSFHERIGPVFIAYMPEVAGEIAVKFATEGKQISDLKSSIAAVEKQWQEVYPNKNFDYQFFDESVAQLYQKEQKTATIITTAMVVAILLSCLGLFGLATFTAAQRTKEIGIRKVLGASVSSIVTLLSKDFLILVIIAFIIATPIAWWAASQWLQDFAYRAALSWWIFGVAGVLAGLIAVLTVSFQAIRAAVANPVESLRSE